MTKTTKPSLERLRDYLVERRTHEPQEPPPDPDEIRRQLGWALIPANRDGREVPD